MAIDLHFHSYKISKMYYKASEAMLLDCFDEAMEQYRTGGASKSGEEKQLLSIEVSVVTSRAHVWTGTSRPCVSTKAVIL